MADLRIPLSSQTRTNGRRRLYANNPRDPAWHLQEHDPFAVNAGSKRGSAGVEEEDIRRAAAVLLACPFVVDSCNLCDACVKAIRARLALIASGTEALTVDECLTTENKSAVPVINHSMGQHLRGQQEHSSEQNWSRVLAGHPTVLSNQLVDEVTTKMAAHSLETSGLQRNYVGKAPSSSEVGRKALSLMAAANENARVQQVHRKKDFTLFERVNGVSVNILKGLELHANVFDELEQRELIQYIYHLQELGRNQMLRRRTYSEPRKWMRGKGRVTIQFGCCYNYAVDKDGNPPGIIREEEVDEIPDVLRAVIKRLVRWHVLPVDSVPDSCIVNIYDVGDCIPPHIDHHDFVRPFCTLSLVSECNIMFGSTLKIIGPGEFKGSISIPLPTGSVLVLNGNGADVAKHAVPAVPAKRISITFRKMDPSKVPYGFKQHPDLTGIKSLGDSGEAVPSSLQRQQNGMLKNALPQGQSFSLESDFPILGATKAKQRT